MSLTFTPIKDVNYLYKYDDMFSRIANGKLLEIPTYRYLILNDLWFVVYFVLGMPNANHKFIIDTCYEVQFGPKSNTLDIWAREHLKSSIITQAETIQYILNNQENTNLVFSYIKPVAKKLIFTIKEIFTNSVFLKKCFPDILYENPEKESPLWSLDEGFIVKRKSNRKEPTVVSSGLVEGMFTGGHFERRIYDDIVTEDIAENQDVMEKVKLKFDSSQNLGIDGGIHRVIGTPYSYDDPLSYIMGKKDTNNPDKPAYHLRLKPATADGIPNGKPIFLSQGRLDELKLTRSYFCQQLLNPAPRETKKLNRDSLKIVDGCNLPERLFKFMIIDPSGKKGTGDPWCLMVVGVNPDKDDVGSSNVYILDVVISKFTLEDAIRGIVDMYCRNGKILQVGVEEVGQSTTEIHVSNALQAKNYNVSVENGNIVIYSPSRRHKIDRIEGLAWPLNNGKIHISKAVPNKYTDIIRAEIDGFPYSKNDHAIDILSYFILDTLPYYRFPRRNDNLEIAQEIPMSAFN